MRGVRLHVMLSIVIGLVYDWAFGAICGEANEQ